MRKYRNTITGVVVEIESELKGTVWELVNPAPASATSKAKKTPKNKKKEA